MSRRSSSGGIVMVFTLATLSGLALATRGAEIPKKVASVEGITEYRLENGLRVLLFPDPTRDKATVNLTVFVGSRHEGYGETGMAHLLEHMLFKPTPTHPDIPSAMKERGAQFNGSTWLDRTNYYETLPASDDNLEFAIRLEADRLVNCPIKPEDLATEFSVVRNEFESGENSPGRVLSQRMTAVAFEWHNYGKSTIGNRTDIERVPVDNLREFYKKFYQPDNAMLVIAGKFDEKKALDLVSRYFGSIPKANRKLPQTYTEEPPQDGERTVTLRRVGDVGILGMIYHVPAGPHEEFPAVEILADVLGAEPSGPLYKALVETKLATSVSVGAEACHDPGILEITAEVDAKEQLKLERVRRALQETIDKVLASGVSEEDVERARRRYLKNREMAAVDPNRIAIQLSEWAAQGDWRLYFLARDRIEKVTRAQVDAAARAYLTPSNRTVGYFIPTTKPERTPVPAAPDVASLVKDYKGRETKANASEAFDTAPLAIEAKLLRPEPIAGVKLVYLPKKTRGESVQFRLSLRYGDLENLRGLNQAAGMLPDLMTRGTKSMTRQQIQDALDKNFARLGGGMGGRMMRGMGGGAGTGSLSFSGQTKRANLPAVLEILRQILREPSLPASEFELMKNEEVSGLEQGRSDPIRLGINHLQRMLSDYQPYDVRYVPTIDEQIDQTKKTTLDQVHTLHDEYLGADHGELTIVGDFDPSEIKPVLTRMFEGWKARKPYTRIESPFQPQIQARRDRLETPDKANAVYIAGMAMPIKDDHPDYPALVAGNFILGGGALSSRIADRLRQKGGLSYTAMSMFSASPLDAHANVMVLAIYNPLNVDKVVTGVDEEIVRLLKDGVTESELSKAKAGYLGQQRNQRTNDMNLTLMLGENLYLGRTMARQAELEKKIGELTPEEVNSALRKHLDPKRLSVVTAGDFAKKAKDAEKK